jgi:hypothetical protein
VCICRSIVRSFDDNIGAVSFVYAFADAGQFQLYSLRGALGICTAPRSEVNIIIRVFMRYLLISAFVQDKWIISTQSLKNGVFEVFRPVE